MSCEKEEMSDSYLRGLLEQKWKLVPEFLRVRGLVKEHIDSYNNFVTVEMQKIVEGHPPLRCKADPNFVMKYTNIYVGKPTLIDKVACSEKPTTPMECRCRSLSYSAPIYVDIIAPDPRKRQDQATFKRIEIGRIPVMLRSCKCVLTGKSESEMANLQECPYDPGGYFIINGIEKVVLTQEQLSKNRIILEEDSFGGVQAAITSSTNVRKSRCVVIDKHDHFFLQHNVFSKPIPIIIAIRAMGFESDQEILSMIGWENHVLYEMEPSLEDAFELGIYTQNQALEYIGSLIKQSRFRGGSKKPKIEDARDTILQVILSHIPVKSYQFFPRAIYLCYMMRQLILARKNRTLLSDKDYYGNKRLELAGNLLSLLFEEYFKSFNDHLEKEVTKALSKVNRASTFDIVKVMASFTSTITGGFAHSISSGNWNVTIYRMERKGITETLSRLSYIAALGQMTRVNSHVEKTRKISGPRALQPSHWGMICPSDTPEGAQCGLVKNLALLAHVTLDQDDDLLIQLLYDLGVEELSFLPVESIYTTNSFIVILNGLILGIHRKPADLIQNVKTLRRNGYIGEFVSIYIDNIVNCVHIASDGGRVCRPLIVVDQKTHKSLVTEKVLDELGRGVRDISSFLKQGLIEYVDANEENSCSIVLNESQINDSTTHVEIDPVTILGIVSALIPFPHHNQSPRNTYQCAMGKQAIGTIGFNQNLRIDVSPLNVIVYPQHPMVRSKVLDLVHFKELPAGQNATVAIMSYSGYDIEDAVILNKASLDRGYGRVTVHKRYQTSIMSYHNNTSDRISGPPRKEDQVDINDAVWAKTFKRYRSLGPDGIVDTEERLEEGDLMVNLETPMNTQDQFSDPSSVTYRPSPLCYKEECGVVDKVMITTSDKDKYIIKIQMRGSALSSSLSSPDMRRPELGDKYSSRHGQKGVVGLIVSQEDMPFNEIGICPDLIMNPHGFPSRMTVGKMIELIAGKAGLFQGKTKYGTAFSGERIDECGKILVENGFNYNGKDLLYSGITGEPLLAYIFMGPIYYQRLKHMVKDKVFARPRGPRVGLTRQPTQGRAREGGLRVGEMEKDCLIAHGTSMLLVERLLKCGLLTYRGWCQYCKTGEFVNEICIPYACKLLFQELESMNVIPRFTLSQGGYFNHTMVENQSFAK